MPHQSARKCLTLNNMNKNVRKIEFAIDGPIFTRACELEKELARGVEMDFKSVIRANYGDCHALGQKPITYLREVLAIVSYPALLDDPKFSLDAKNHARELLNGCEGNSVGAYTLVSGLESTCTHVSQFIEKRDKYPSDPESIFLTNGASEAIISVLRLFTSNNDIQSGVMIPIPQYPIYSAALTLLNLHQINYYLDEDHNWSLSLVELKRAIKEARKICNPRAIVVINPGNPTGQVLTKDNTEMIIKFAYEENLVILADEVYQMNVYDPKSKFSSFKKVLCEMGTPYAEMELASFMSVSKAYLGECGVRGGYCELFNFDPQIRHHLMKSLSVRSNPNIYGQMVIDVLVNPPKHGNPSFAKYEAEKEAILKSLAIRAALIEKRLTNLKYMTCNPLQGAMYAFPRIYLPPRAIEAATARNMEPDEFYVFELLEATGICITAGSGFGQVPGTYHFRTTILPQRDRLEKMLDCLENFHNNFMFKYIKDS